MYLAVLLAIQRHYYLALSVGSMQCIASPGAHEGTASSRLRGGGTQEWSQEQDCRQSQLTRRQEQPVSRRLADRDHYRGMMRGAMWFVGENPPRSEERQSSAEQLS